MKIFSFLLSAFVFITSLGVVSAQTQEDMNASLDRIQKLEDLFKKEIKATKDNTVDNYVSSVKSAADTSKSISGQLQKIYDLQKNGSKIAGMINELTDLSVQILELAKEIKTAAESADKIANSVKTEKNPMKAAAIAKAVAVTAEACPVLVEESAFQVKTIDLMIQTAKAGK